VLSTKSVEGTAVKAVRVVGILHGDSPGKKAEDLQERLWSFRKDDWKKWNGDLVEWNIIEKIGDGTRVVYERIDVPWPVRNRDLEFVQKKLEKDGKFFLLMFSTEHTEAPIEPKKCVPPIQLSFSLSRKATTPSSPMSPTRIPKEVSPPG